MEVPQVPVPSIPVWFVCKVCTDSFQKVEQFILHKKEKHFDDFQKIKCIVFEEKSGDAILHGSEDVSGVSNKFPRTRKVHNNHNVRVTRSTAAIAVKQEQANAAEFRQTINTSENQTDFTSFSHPETNNLSPFSEIHPHTSPRYESVKVEFEVENPDNDLQSILPLSSELNYTVHNPSTDVLLDVDSHNNFDFDTNFILGNIDCTSTHCGNENERDPLDWNVENEIIPECETKLFIVSNSIANQYQNQKQQQDEPLLNTSASTSTSNKVKVPSSQNPVVLVKRLTSKELENIHGSDNFTITIAKKQEREKRPVVDTSDPLNPQVGLLVYRCHMCNKTFNSEPKFKVHAGICRMYNSSNNKALRKSKSATVGMGAGVSVLRRRRRNAATSFFSPKEGEDRDFVCHVCLKRFKTNSHVREHLETHVVTKELECPHPGCPKLFRTSRQRRAHYSRNHSHSHTAMRRRRVRQRQVTQKVPSIQIIEAPKHSLPQYTCSKCNDVFYTKSSLKRHDCRMNESFFEQNEQLIEQIYIQPEIQETFSIPEPVNMEIPDLIHQNVELDRDLDFPSMCEYECYICSQDFQTEEELTSHIEKHNIDSLAFENSQQPLEDFHDPVASTSVSALSSTRMEQILEEALTRQSQSTQKQPREQQRRYKCTVDNCGKTFFRLRNLKSHKALKHGIEPAEKDLSECSCHLCGKTLLKVSLARHIKEHYKERIYQCSVPGCTLAFKRNNDLKRHETRHLIKLNRSWV